MNPETVIKNTWRVYPRQIEKVKKLAKKRKCSQSEIIRLLIERAEIALQEGGFVY